MASATTSRGTPPSRDRGDRAPLLAVAATFAVNGLLFSSLLPRYPQIVEATGATAATFGLALVGVGVGGFAAGSLVPALIRAVGLTRLVAISGVVLAGGVVLIAAAPSVPLLAAALAVAGAADAVHDVSMNEVALGEQQRRRGSVMGRLHGTWSLGSTAGTAVGAGMAALEVPVALHMGVVAVGAAGVQLLVARHLRGRAAAGSEVAGEEGVRADGGQAVLPVPPDAVLGGAAPRRVGVRVRVRAIGLLVAVAIGAILAEVTPLDWSALMLERGLGATAGLAGLGPLVFSAGVLLGRGGVDAAVDRLGPGRVVLLGNGAAAGAIVAGQLAAGLGGVAWPALVGIAVAGVGVSGNFPLLFGAGDAVSQRLGLPEGTGTSIVGTLPRMGGLVLPAAVGLLATAIGLVGAFAVAAAGAVLVAALLPRVLAR